MSSSTNARLGRRVLVCGGRSFNDGDMLRQELDRLLALTGPWSAVMHGAAPGADSLAGEWAAARGIPVQAFKVDWGRYGSKAGPKRNRQMLEQGKPDLVVAFPGGHGTAHMARIALAAGVRVIEIAGKATEPNSEIRGGALDP